MKKQLLTLLLTCISVLTFSQVTYIGILNHNTGSGSNNLFNQYVAVGQACFIDWEVYAEGMNSSDNCGDKSVSRLVLRRMAQNDPTSLVASAPIYVPGICGGKNGNNDKFYADLGSYIDRPGRYSVEIQADLANLPNPFESGSTRTTYNYACPSAYYLTGTGGATGSYYVPAGSCAGGPGLSDPVGNASLDLMPEIFTTLKFFTVGEVATYRQMVIFGNQFYDLIEGKFQPGNPVVPASLNGTQGIPAAGICPLNPAPTLSIGAEINNFKRTDCGNADVTGAALFYRVYKEGDNLPAYSSFALDFSDDCNASPNGPEGNNFPTGGSCQNGNGILDQRWQKVIGAANILPASFSLSDTGTWRIDFYTVTYGKNCAGADITDQSGINSTSFTVNNPNIPGSPCSSVIPVRIRYFTVTPNDRQNQLNWKVEEAGQVSRFEVLISTDGYRFSSLGFVPYSNGRSVFAYTDAAHPGKTVYYRLAVHEFDGSTYYSSIIRVNPSGKSAGMTILPGAGAIDVRLQHFKTGRYQLQVFSAGGSRVADQTIDILHTGYTHRSVGLQQALSQGIYLAVLRDESGQVVARSAFRY